MRNLKRALSLTLASVMLLGMMVVGAGAAGFPDVDDEDNVEAIEVLNAVEVILGYDNGDFGPDDLVTRAQMAVIMAKLLNLDYQYYEATCPFTDVPAWARGYVGACYAKGITSGYSATIYGPNDGITPVQAASMMMRALGYFKYSQDYSAGFEVATVSQGSEIGIFKGVGSSATAQMTRNQVAKMALNALQSEMVTFTGTPGMEVNGVVVGYRAEYTSRTSTEAKYNAIEGRTSDVASDANHKGQYYIQLGEELYDGKLTRKFARDEFERPSINWQYDGKDIGTYVDYDLKKAEYRTGVTGADLYDLLTYTTINDNALLCYVDGVENTDITKNTLVRSNKNDVAGSGTGVLTEVFVDLFRNQVTITSINTYLAQANSDYNQANETLSLKVYQASETGVTKIVDSAVVPEAEGVSKEDYVLVYMSGKDNAANYDVVRLFDVEIMSNSEITKFSIDGAASGKKVVKELTTNGVEYKTNTKAFYDHGNVLDSYDAQLLSDMTYNIYMDRYDNVIGVDLYEGTRNYVFITGYDRGNSHISVKTADAAAIFMDGTMDTITVNVTDTNKNIESAQKGNTDYAEYSLWSGAGDIDDNRWYTYTQAANGNYTLKPVKNFMYSAYTAGATPYGDPIVTLNSANLVLHDDGATNRGYAYGEDASVYLTVEAGRVDLSCATIGHETSGKVGATVAKDLNDAIVDVAGRYTGAQDVKIDLTQAVKEEVNHEKTTAEKDAYAYTIYDNKYFIIASVILGEAQGASANYILPLSGAKNERVEKGSTARAASDDTYYWEFDAVVDGAKTTLTVKSKYESVFTGQRTVEDNQYMPVEVRYDGEYVTEIKEIDPAKVFTDNRSANKIKDMKIYDMGNVTGSAWTAADNGVTTIVDGTKSGLANPSDGFGPARRIDGTIQLQGRTLYTERPNDVGLALATDAKAVLIQPENGKIEVNSCGSVEEALGRLADRNNNADGTQFKGRIMAVLDSNGVAQWLVIFSDTNLITGNDPNYNNYNGNVSVTTGEKDMLNVLNGSKIEVLRTGTSRMTLNLDAPDWADVNSAAGDLTFTATLMMDGKALDYVDFTSAASASVNSNAKTGNVKVNNTNGKLTFTGTYDNAFGNLYNYLFLNMINGSFDFTDHDFAVVISNINWKNAAVKYVYDSRTGDDASGAMGTVGNSNDSFASVKIGAAEAGFKFTFTLPTATRQLKAPATQASYEIQGATLATGETVKLADKITDGTAVTFSNGIQANGNGYVYVIIKDTEAKAVTPPAPTKTYTVKANTALNGKVLFAVVDSTPTASDITAPTTKWESSLSKIASGKYVMVKSATDGVKLKSGVAGNQVEAGTAVATTQIDSEGVFYFQMPADSVNIHTAEQDVVEATGVYVSKDLTKINAILSKVGTDEENAAAIIAYINAHNKDNTYSLENLTAALAYDARGTTVIGVKVGTSDVTFDNIGTGVAADMAKVKINSDGTAKEIIAKAADTVETALDLEGVAVTGGAGSTAGKVYVLVKRGTDTIALANTKTTANTDLATVLAANDEIITNGVNGYAELTDPVVTVGGTLTGTLAATVKAGDSVAAKAGTAGGSKNYVKVGVTFTVTITGFTAVADAATNTTGAKINNNSSTGAQFAITSGTIAKNTVVETTTPIDVTITVTKITGAVAPILVTADLD